MLHMLQQLEIVVFVLLKKYFLDILSHGALIFIFFQKQNNIDIYEAKHEARLKQ